MSRWDAVNFQTLRQSEKSSWRSRLRAVHNVSGNYVIVNHGDICCQE